jgi:tetratricopeptide (TPR) repeat protein
MSQASSAESDSAAGRQISTGGGSYIEGDPKIAGDFVAGDKVVAAPPTGAAALHQLPSPPADFTGRAAELADLRAAASPNQQSEIHASRQQSLGAAIFGLRGQGGVGKTALALVLAHELAPRYSDAQLYVDLRGADEQAPIAPAEALAAFLHAFEPTAQLPEALAERQAIYRSRLQGKSALVVLDNARDKAQVEPLLPPPGCLVLVTSRQRFALPGLVARNLDSLPRADAVALLLRIAPRIGDQAEALATLCGDLPLALRVAASAMAEREDLGVADYRARLADESRRLTELAEVGAAFSVSYGLLPPAAQAAWPVLSVFSADFDRPAAVAVLGLNEEPSATALSDLVRYSLLEYDGDRQRYRLHDLARLAAAQRLSPEARQNASFHHARHYVSVLATCQVRYNVGNTGVVQGLALFDQERTNIEAGQAWTAARFETSHDLAQLCGDYADVGAYVLDLRHPPRQQIAWCEAALAAARRLKNKSAEGVHLGNLGNAYAALGEPRRAIELYQQRLAIAREIGDRRGEGAALGNLGNAYAALGEPRRAIELYQQDLAIARKIGDRRGEGAALGNLGNAYAALGEPRRAIDLYEQLLTIAREIGDRRGEGIALWNMSLALEKLGERDAAIARAEASLRIKEQIEDPSAERVRQRLAEWKAGSGA